MSTHSGVRPGNRRTGPGDCRFPPGDRRIRVAIVGPGRLGNALSSALRDAGHAVLGPLGRGANTTDAEAVLLCVPDSEITRAAAAIGPGPLVGHCSGATGLDALAPHEAFSLHPLMTVTARGASFRGAGAAVDGTTPAALRLAQELATAVGMKPTRVLDGDRAAYHAAASIASNFLVTLEAAAERLAGTVGVEREALVALVRASVENWASLGPESALTGPVARGDEPTVEAQREAIRDRAPELTELFDAMVALTRALASSGRDPEPISGASARMRTVCTIGELRSALAEHRRDGARIGLVPTMGAFHDGHLSLMRRAREQCEVVVVSLFVNPGQFNDDGDLASYPRDERRDRELAEKAGVDYLFAPSVEQIYPPGFATTVSVAGITEVLEGASRGREHFDAVTTVVTKLLNIVGPQVAYFGQKDAQQALVIARMVRDLDIPVAIELGATVRERDGLAMSSRNGHLSADDRVRAAALHRALESIQEAIAAGERDPAAARARALAELTGDGLEPEYLELVAPHTLTPVTAIDGEPILALIAARVGQTRLIDNQLIHPLSTAHAAGSTKEGRP